MGTTEQEPLDVATVRSEYPILDREVADGVQLAYLDNAATSLTPERVVDALTSYYREFNANVHRGIHELSQEASIAYEAAHDRLAEFVGGADRSEMVFTGNTTHGINLVARAWGLEELGPGDEIVLTEMAHHATLVTWQQVAKRTGATVRFLSVGSDGTVDLSEAADVIGPDTALLSVLHVSNVMGSTVPVQELAEMAHEEDALVLIDGAQAVPNRPVDVTDLGADLYAFSGHKMAGPTGIGGLWGRADFLADLDPPQWGGGMIEKVTFEESTWHEVPWKFEPGTPPIAEGVALAEAADYLDDLGLDRIRHHEEGLAKAAHERLETIDGVEVYGPAPAERGGLVSFNLEGVHAHDLSSILNEHGVAVRAGDHCTQPLHDTLGVPASVRASFYVYNTTEEVERLVDGVRAAKDLFA
ncbi:MAG: aminotransferase class V-fold PLP-dependent enzyme [Halobacteriaceae archaeon]